MVFKSAGRQEQSGRNVEDTLQCVRCPSIDQPQHQSNRQVFFEICARQICLILALHLICTKITKCLLTDFMPTGISAMVRQGFESREVMWISGHKNPNNLSSYNSATETDKMKMALSMMHGNKIAVEYILHMLCNFENSQFRKLKWLTGHFVQKFSSVSHRLG